MRVIFVEDRVVVRAVDTELTDIPVGSVITAINGIDSVEYLNKHQSRLSAHHPLLTRNAILASRFFWRSARMEAFAIEAKTPTEETISEYLVFTSKEPSFSSFLPQVNYGNINDEPEYVTNTFWAQRHIGNILRIRVEHFGDQHIEQEIREYLINSFEADAVIIDVRGHSGGNSNFGLFLLSHFVDITQLNHPIGIFNGRRVYIAQEHLQLHKSLNEQSVGLYNLPIIILSDHFTGSAGEDFVAVSKGVTPFTVMGTTTMGVTGNLTSWPLPGGGSFFITTQRTLTHNGQDIAHNGVAPDIWVEQTYRDLLSGIDTQLMSAIEYLQEKIYD